MPEGLPYKITTLIYLENELGHVLLLRRRKAPNEGMWSPIGGKLEMGTGESPHEAAARETLEETGLSLSTEDLHLFGMIAEKNYEYRTHWLMFLFCSKVRLKELPPPMDEGEFAFHDPRMLEELDVPETDRKALWPLWRKNRGGFTVLRADCSPDRALEVIEEQRILGPG